jgi:precorrin-6B methylase 2
MAGQSLELIPQLLGDGDRAAALERARRLLTQIRRARDEGVSPENLAVAASRARQLLEHIEQAPVR